ncbi:MAG TPA: hypothetical protein VFO67_15520, partial [Gemmatimonadales bacterium]|nr:hypothetical protein [Gemmatimonadales bacterium]
MNATKITSVTEPLRSHTIRMATVLAAGLLAFSAVSAWRTPMPYPSSRSALESTFARDVRNLVYRWDPNDPRPPQLRQAALLSFLYQTYDTSAWIPHALFEGNLVTQVVSGD